VGLYDLITLRNGTLIVILLKQPRMNRNDMVMFTVNFSSVDGTQ